MIRTNRTYLLVVLLLAAALEYAFAAVGVPPGFAAKQVATGLRSPTTMAFSPDGRLFVCEQGGRLRVIRHDTLRVRPFLTVSVDSVGERGLLGVAFDPDFASNNYLYVYYTSRTPATHNRVSRFTSAGDSAVPGSEQVIFELDNLGTATIHNGGALHFGTDNKLYIATGENSVGSNAQSKSTVLGKLLRINSDGSIPSDNPFYDSTTGNNRAIWALGLRNPFTFAVQPGTGTLLINDVGLNSWEEINNGVRGSNYGWPASEGFTANPLFRGPLLEYGHGTSDSTGCAISGADFYNPPLVQYPGSYVGRYFYADYCGGWIRSFNPADSTSSLFATGLLFPVDVHVDTAGSLYYLMRGNTVPSGQVGKIQYSPGLAPVFSTQPSNVTVQIGKTATFTAIGSGDPPITYQWQRNGVNISLATSTTYSLLNAQLSDSGAVYRSIATNPFGKDTSDFAILSVVTNHPPVGAILTPLVGTLYSGGDTISYRGSGIDPEQKILPPQSFTWMVDFHHDEHHHPFIPPTTGADSGSFVIPVVGETSDTVWYRIYLVVADSNGLTDTTFVDILPRKSTNTITSIPPGLSLFFDGSEVVTPYVFTGVVGIVRSISAPASQVFGGQTYAFNSWSDGGAATHNISTPVSNSVYTATLIPALGILSASPLPSGIVSVTYADTLIASGGIAPYRWSVLSGSLPSGISLSSTGILSGTPLTGGIGNVTIQVADTTDSTASKAFSLTINNLVPTLSAISPQVKTRGGAGFIMTVTGTNFISGAGVRIDGVSRPTTFISATTLTAVMLPGDIAAAGTHAITVFVPVPGGGSSNSLPLTVVNPALSAKAFLQGPFHSGSMSTSLRTSGFIPLAQSYSSGPWKYFGTEVVASVPANVVDWVLVEIRSGTSAATRVGRRAAFIRSDGTIVDTNGTGPVVFPGVNVGSYYVVLHHRNHLSVMSSSAVSFSDSAGVYDFTTGTGKFFGGQASSLGGGLFGAFAGDYSVDGFIDSDDFTGPDNDVFKSGYLRSDINLDGFVDSDDFIDTDNNVFKSTSVPN